MKKLTLIVAALALMMGFSQCKKDNLTPNDNRIQITLNANYGGNGSRTTFDPEHGTFNWLQGNGADVVEYINVGGSQSGYLGQLNNNDNKGTGTFNGSITTPADGETLYFFYLGNGSHEGATTLDFSNQSNGTVTDWHIAIGSSSYTSGDTDFSATLNMAMAIAYFDLHDFGEGSIYLNGDNVYSTATINYTSGTISGNSKGYINLGTANYGKYVALIPSVETETTLHFNSSSKTGEMTFLRGIKPASYYSNGGSALEVSATDGSGIPGTFSVSATKKVFFSKGNLQYIGSAATPYWKFADNQYDILGTTTSQNSNSTNVDRDLFGWGTSGWDNGNKCYQPYETSKQTSGDYASSKGYGYGPTDGTTYTFDLTGTYAEADWGVHNSIRNGGTGWRTLTGNTGGEWDYLLNTRSASTINGTPNARYIQATVCDVEGIILFPDVYTHPLASYPSQINKSNNYWSTNVYNETEWLSMEAAGAIFLPRAGYRDGTNVTSGDVYYWSSTNAGTASAYSTRLGPYGNAVNTSRNRYSGCCVRLVKDVQ